MKTVLILVLSCDLLPYRKMISNSQETWDSFEVDGVETIYITGASNTNSGSKEVNLPIVESLYSIGDKTLQSFDYVLKNKEFDYVARVNSSTYVDKKQLIKYIQNLDNENVFSGLIVKDSIDWAWGWQYVLSKDVVKKIVDNRHLWNHKEMDDKAISFLAHKIGISLTDGMACSIDKCIDSWRLIGYGSESIVFTDFKDVKPLNQVFYRVKQDYDRNVDGVLMNELHNALK